jgi:RNA polymerase sigma-70 factor (ECF subfamily)
VNSSNSWQRVLAAERRWLGTIIFARIGDHHAVDEVLQETALAASRHCQHGDTRGVSRWLYRVAVRQSLLYRRRTARIERRARSLADSQPQRANPDPEALVIASEQRDLVQQALAALSRGDCEILLLKYIEDWSCREIADRLGVSETAVKSRLLRARNTLRAELLRINEHWVVP